ncbi:hypothetical protein F0562_018940 [Nyssa sinensis]|uniref:F-box associated beta-propeller type 3 domain-containing protein n=1 Tax=Nyssa sinensis TaxID=561372 RepID=A0A5J4ZC38_9ASTE|nr:hypothetical protein F0562_018940 [Nyssa sinensis]
MKVSRRFSFNISLIVRRHESLQSFEAQRFWPWCVLWCQICQQQEAKSKKNSKKGVNGNGGCEVLTIGSDDLSWRPLNIPNLHDLKKRENPRVLLHREVFYCFRFVEAGSGDSEVVCLNLENENSTSVKVPHYFFSNWKKVWPVIWNGKVSLVGIAGEELTVWVLEDYKKQKWAERKIVIALTFMKENPSMKESLVPCGYAGSHRVTFYVNYLKLLVYYIDTKEVRYSETAPEGKRILCFNKSNLVTLKGMQPQMKQITNELAKSD